MTTALEHGSEISTSSHARLLFTAGSLLVAAGRNQEVAAQLDESIRLAHEAGDHHTLSWALTQRGFVAVFTGQPDLAGPILDQVCTPGHEHGDPYATAMAAIGKAHTSIALGDPRRAALLYGAADLLMEQNVSHFPVLQQLSDRCRAAVTGQLGEDLFTVTLQQGRALPVGDAITLAAGPG